VLKDLVGTLYRVAPGQKEHHGVMLRYLFDGDAFVCGFSFRAGQVHLHAVCRDTRAAGGAASAPQALSRVWDADAARTGETNPGGARVSRA
jgi:carotenoid cleavage dioxygenase-like enzyme